MTASYNFTVRAGNSGTTKNDEGLQVRLRAGDPLEPVDLTGDEFVFRVLARNTEAMRKDTDGDITVDLVEAIVTVPFSVADSRTLAGPGRN